VILVDSSVWIDYFCGAITRQTETLDALLGVEPVATGDLILTEVLQGFIGDRDFQQAKRLMTALVLVDLAGKAIAVKAAKTFARCVLAASMCVRRSIRSSRPTASKSPGASLQRQGLRSVRRASRLALRLSASPFIHSSKCAAGREA
jgi:hypothetical protein